jgi:CRP-like cAMP-binding protein
MAKDEKLDMLHSMPLFARLDRHGLERLGQLADEIDVPAGRVLMRQGESGSEMFFIVRGRVRVERNGRVLAEPGPNSWIGEMSLLSEGPRTATVTATEPTRLLLIAHREFHALMDDLPSVRLCVLEALADRVRELESETPH